MGFNVAAMLAHVILELPPNRVKSFPNRRCEPLLRLTVRYQLLTRHGQPDVYRKWTALAMMLNRRLNGHVASGDTVEVTLERARLFPDFPVDSFGQSEVTCGNV